MSIGCGQTNKKYRHIANALTLHAIFCDTSNFIRATIKNLKTLMSAIASFYLLDTSQLDELRKSAEIIVKKSLFSKKVTDNYLDYLSNNAKELQGFDGSGYIYGNLLVFLQEEKNIDLTQNEYDDVAKELIDKRGSSHFILTYKQKTAFISQLDPSEYSLAVIQQFNQNFSEEGDAETASLTHKAIEVLRDNLSMVQNDNQILLLIVG
ncbi:hypothetical protein WG954_13770 [Lacibacter sp. H375]|uniref:hypothetical protein n=1 Tax=Lacibacter sp. H375 TaxID=3133424 RepID=UPI0030BD2CF4